MIVTTFCNQLNPLLLVWFITIVLNYLSIVSVLSAQPNAPEDEHALMSVNQTLGVAEETTVYIDKIITIREVTAVDGGRVIEDSQVIINFKIFPAPYNLGSY